MSEFERATRDILRDKNIGQSGPMKFHAANASIEFNGALVQDGDYLGGEIRAFEQRWLMSIDLSVVPDAKRGDRVTDPHGVDWILDEMTFQDDWMQQWAVTRK